MFLGDRVKDQYGAAAVFDELASSPAGMEASKFCDAYGLLEGHKVECADGLQAYCQAPMGGTECWITVPRDEMCGAWRGKDMVVKLEKALYGHPLSGAYWERHCNQAVGKCGFVPIGNCLNGQVASSTPSVAYI